MRNQKWVIKPRVAEKLYTNHEELLSFFYKAARETANRKSMSTVLLGHRRMGKTEIFKRVVNRLFFSQNVHDPKAVVPVYYCFTDSQKTDETIFALDYLENFIRYYVGFYTRQPQLISDALKGKTLLKTVNSLRNAYPFSRTFDLLFTWYEQIQDGCVYPAKDALEIPRRISDSDDTSIVMFIDEFQNVRLPQFDFDIVGYYQDAADSNTCPHFVTGSAMSILSMEIVGSGALFGRFDYERINGMTAYHGTQLALNAANYYDTSVSEIVAPYISERCGGNPFYINAIIQQSAKRGKPITSIETLNDILAVDITSGFIWGELCDQVNRWIERINEFHVTKYILYFAVIEKNMRAKNGEISIENIQNQLKHCEGIDVERTYIRDIMIKLSRGDLLEYHAGSFFRIKDPILCDFLKVWGKIEIEKLEPEKLKNELRTQYYVFNKKSINEYKGYLGEIHMSQILLASQTMILPGKFFHSMSDINIPDFSYVRHRVRLSSGENMEIDLIGAAGPETWICQSKWLERKKVDVRILKDLLLQVESVNNNMPDTYFKKWIFAYSGLTKPAETFARENEILWSSKSELDELLKFLNLRALYSF